MHTPESHPRTVLAVSILVALAAGCAGADPMTGTWRQEDGTIFLPDGTPLDADVTLGIDGAASTFDLHLDLEVSGLSDTFDAHATYVDTGSALELTFTGITVPAGSESQVSTGENGEPCVELAGFGGAVVCLPTPQSNGYVLAGDSFAITVDHTILGVPSSTDFDLARAQ